MAQVQCPNCGGYKINTESKVTISTEKRQAKSSLLYKVIEIVVLGPFILALVFLAIIFLQSGNWLGLVTGAVVGVSALALAVVLFNVLTDRNTKTVPSVIKYNLFCELCGYRWTWQNDQPYPNVNVNPALIQQGEQRLEEERRRQQQRDAEAAFYLNQQRNK